MERFDRLVGDLDVLQRYIKEYQAVHGRLQECVIWHERNRLEEPVRSQLYAWELRLTQLGIELETMKIGHGRLRDAQARLSTVRQEDASSPVQDPAVPDGLDASISEMLEAAPGMMSELRRFVNALRAQEGRGPLPESVSQN